MTATTSLTMTATTWADEPFRQEPAVEAPVPLKLQICGVVIHGAKLGRTIGFPTANMKIENSTTLLPGIYAVRFQDAFGVNYAGVASFGRRPTVTNYGDLLLETYVLDFTGDLYGQECIVTFVEYLREEAKFASLAAMVDQIGRDVSASRKILEADVAGKP